MTTEEKLAKSKQKTEIELAELKREYPGKSGLDIGFILFDRLQERFKANAC
jgi:hypothetical protein